MGSLPLLASIHTHLLASCMKSRSFLLLRSLRSSSLSPSLARRRAFPSIRPRYFSASCHVRGNHIHDNTMGKEKVQLKPPKGTRDWDGKDMVIREHIFDTIQKVFKLHGGVTIDTPVFELKEILTGKYGEDSKLIYDLADQGGELCSLRYDLTVPFARYLAMNPNIQSIKRYHLAKVYRRDQPAVAKGRMREFYQCDFDIAGAADPMVPDVKIIRITCDVFKALGWEGKYTIKTNHRKILDGIFEVCGVPKEKLRMTSSAVDKLDKSPWSEVRREMTEEKGLDGAVADKIGEFVTLKGGAELLDTLMANEALAANESAKKGLDDMKLFFRYLKNFNILDSVSFDMSLARGLDYYTGVIYEVVTEGSAPTSSGKKQVEAQQEAKAASKKKAKGGDPDDEDRSNDPTLGVGSIAAGGRYDELVGMFNPKGQIPCVGISFGVDRIFSITKKRLEQEQAQKPPRSTEVDVFIMAFGGKGFTGLLDERMELASTLLDAGIKADFLYKMKPKLPQQFKAAENISVPYAVILGEDELANGQVKIKRMGLPEDHPQKDGVLVQKSDIVNEVRQRIRSLEEGLDELSLAGKAS